MLSAPNSPAQSPEEDELSEWISKAELLEQNLDIQHRKYHLKTYKNVFVGSAAIYVMINLKFATSDAEAVKFGNELMQRNIIKHVTEDHIFKNEDLFYQFVPAYNRPSARHKMQNSLSMSLSFHSRQLTNELDIKFMDKEELENKSYGDDDDEKIEKKSPKSTHILPFKRRKETSNGKIEKYTKNLTGHEKDALNLFDCICRGSLFYFEWNEALIKNETQKALALFIENWLNDAAKTQYFQSLFDEKMSAYMHKEGIFINIEEIQNLNQELMEYFFDVNAKAFKGKIFLKPGFEQQCVCIQFLEIPEIICLNEAQINLIKDKKHFAEILFPKFEVTNKNNEIFIFYLKVKRNAKKRCFDVYLLLKSMPENCKKTRLIWDFVCRELEFEHIGKQCELKRNVYDQIDGFSLASMDAIKNKMTFIVNIRIIL